MRGEYRLFGSMMEVDPENIRQSDMDRLADAIETYLHELESVMIIPEDLLEDHGDEMKRSISLTKKLIKKLRKGDRSVFKDPEDWNNVI